MSNVTIPICEHIKAGGKRCGSPAIRGQRFCYYHVNLYRAMPLTTLFYEKLENPGPGDLPYLNYDLPPLEDAASIQIGFMQVLRGVATHGLDTKRARLILSALHGAAKNLRLLNDALPPMPPEPVAQDQPASQSEAPPRKKPSARTRRAASTTKRLA